MQFQNIGIFGQKCFGRIGLCDAATISDVRMNRFFISTYNKEADGDQQHRSCPWATDELKIALLMVAMDDAHETQQSNVDALLRQEEKWNWQSKRTW